MDNNTTLINNLLPLHGVNIKIKNIIIVIIGSILLIISAKIKIPIPPVPVTLQTLVVLVFAMSVGWKIAVTTFVFYLFQGTIGLPVFANPPYGGPTYLMGSSGGYLLGMLLASYLVGYLAEKNYDRNYFKSLVVIFVGTLVIFIPGLIWLGMWFNFFHPNAESLNSIASYKLALIHGLLAFKFTEPVKIALAPSTASDKVKQLASFSIYTCLFNFFSKSFLSGLPFNHIEFAFLTKEVSFETIPGMPIPIDSTLPKLISISSISDSIPSMVP